MIRRGSFALMDILVVLFVASIGLSEILHEPILNDGIFSATSAFVSMVLSYIVGRQLIEPELRFATIRRFVTLVLLDAGPSLFEWRMSRSLYGMFGNDVLGLPDVRENVILRDGHGRVGEVFGGGETAGIAFGMTFCLNSWLVYLRRARARVDFGKALTLLQKYHLPKLVLFLCVWFTQSRGPLMALAAGYLVLQIPRFKNIRLVTFAVAVLLVGGYFAATAYFASYASAGGANPVDEQRSSVLYRSKMNQMYSQVADAGGWTGWSQSAFPRVAGMGSIDNHYLLVHLSWGWLGYIFFLLLVCENIRIAVLRSWQFKSGEDRVLVVSLLAAMAVLWITLLTVFMGGQLPEISFLLMGWIQSIVPGKVAISSGPSTAKNRNAKFFFEKVYT
jgi:hypothetical protein